MASYLELSVLVSFHYPRVRITSLDKSPNLLPPSAMVLLVSLSCLPPRVA